jgi:hypothetical protein
LDPNKHPDHIARINVADSSRAWSTEENTGSSFAFMDQACSYIKPKVWTMHSMKTCGVELALTKPNKEHESTTYGTKTKQEAGEATIPNAC